MNSSIDLLLLIVAYHPKQQEIDELGQCLEQLPEKIRYAIVANDYKPGEPINKLSNNALKFIRLSSNLGYGRAANLLANSFVTLPPYVAVLNTDLSWSPETFPLTLQWLFNNKDVCLAVPQIVNQNGDIEKLCKRNPTLLALFSRRFLPEYVKPKWLKRYDAWYCMNDHDYTSVFESSYLSGCCMIINSSIFINSGGFDERFFLYLEDADLTRRLTSFGKCVHLPYVNVIHNWGRGNHKKMWLSIINIFSACKYFFKWGLSLW
tara:strand:- start:2202 stop:2990 length:789 start_codon:yes stop_codon:yes gene_type:complete